MSEYYCPFCSSRYQFHKAKGDGVLICGLCGDPLVKKTYFDYKRTICLIAATVFLAPLVVMIIFVLKELTSYNQEFDFESITLFYSSI